jgi:hypothetical protein
MRTLQARPQHHASRQSGFDRPRTRSGRDGRSAIRSAATTPSAEGSFAEARRHHFKRARWRRLWRQQIQDWLIAAIQNIKTLAAAAPIVPQTAAGVAAAAVALVGRVFPLKRRSTFAPVVQAFRFNPT